MVILFTIGFTVLIGNMLFLTGVLVYSKGYRDAIKEMKKVKAKRK